MIRWSRFQRERAERDTLLAWWEMFPTANVGIVMGGVSNLVAWDIDDEAGECMLRDLCGGDLPPTLEFMTGGGGRRLLFGWGSQPMNPPAHFKTAGKALSFLGERSQTTAPPSLHQSGRRYAWRPGRGPGEFELADFPPAGVLALTLKGRRNSERGGGVPARAKVTPSPNGTAKWARARGMAASWAPAIEGSGGRVVAFHLACALIHGLGLSVDDALEVMLEEWNGRCDPPWPEDELRERVVSAQETGQYTPIPERPFPRSARTSTAPSPRSSTAEPPTKEEEDDKEYGRLASTLEPAEMEWLCEPWVARGFLTLVAGGPNCGKSTLGAYLMSIARRSVVLPGCEEDAALMMRPRMLAHGVDLDSVLVLDEEGWEFPLHRDRLARTVRRFNADLIWIDPVDNYLGAADENDGQSVRAFLEALFWVARQCRCAVVGVRHPGKAAGNLLPGSRQWRTVPRMVLELIVDEGPPLTRICRPNKDSLGQGAPAVHYELEGEPGSPRLWRWRHAASQADVELAQGGLDPIDRWKIDQAAALIPALLSKGEMESRLVYRAGLDECLNDRIMRYAAKRLGILYRREGQAAAHRCYWRLPKGFTPATPEKQPDTPPAPAP